MNEGERLRRAVLLSPHSDEPRLVYADWLEENGDEARQRHAAFIRAGIRRSRSAMDARDCPDYAECCDLIGGGSPGSAGLRRLLSPPGMETQYREVLRRTHPGESGWNWQWVALLSTRGPVFVIEPFLARGFAERISCGMRAVLSCHDSIWEAHPVRHVDFIDLHPVESELEGLGWEWLADSAMEGSDWPDEYDSAAVPDGWFRLLPPPVGRKPGEWRRAGRGERASGYESEAVARAALSVAVADWAERARAKRWAKQAG